jgi:S-adenosylmethionine-dependent methyltransferase
MATSRSDPFADLADTFGSHYATLRGVVRLELLCRQLAQHLPPPPATVVDVGGGGGQVALRLAEKGYDVTIVDPSAEMLRQAEALLAGAPDRVQRRIDLVEVSGLAAPARLGEREFDVVCCHGVLAYLEEPDPMVRALVLLARPSGVISILAKQGAALALRPGLQGRWTDALAVLDADRDAGNLGAVTRADTLDGLELALERGGAELTAWYGVRLLTDHLGPVPPGPDLPDILEAEWQVSLRDPYRSVSRMLHVVGRRTSP